MLFVFWLNASLESGLLQFLWLRVGWSVLRIGIQKIYFRQGLEYQIKVVENIVTTDAKAGGLWSSLRTQNEL